MDRRLALSLLVLPLLSVACAFGYYARGTLSDVPGELRGKAFPGNTAGGGRFVLADQEGRLRCDGEMAAPDSSPVPVSCEGESGKGIVRCSDGRVMAARWTAISCRSFLGSAEDERGNRLLFRVERKL
ncbi:hypothetical protein LZ012_12885 [Dechloromonas sp. XY25]|uniref:Lipoprotein n=1 Tax=Dechloromonas hankyongensis TaxID=2908002 RepID=A0ABS9K404_9RHOO|nr:hypothetical protein [Dechloromonas hankyongensis]MCG2577886.1 hypothetical protein [Dechloromonas hankyongensis]